jgi:hypothetical protein
LLELSLTRIFSVVFYYHFAFLAISIALFGLGVGGVFSYVVARWKPKLFNKLGVLALLNAAAVVFSLVFLLSRRGDLTYFALACVYIACALPFVFTGAIVSLAVSETIERVDRVYFFDLLGAAAGCLVLIPLLNSVGGPNTTLAAAILFGVSSAIWFTLAGAARRRILAVAAALSLTTLVIVNTRTHWIDVRYAKGVELKGEQFSKWNSFSRIGLKPNEQGHQTIYIDADASTGLASYDFDRITEAQKKDLLTQGPGLPFVVRPGAKTLIIGPGGGYDVARALASGSKNVTGVEINPIIATTIMRQRYPELSQRIYFRPDVRIFVEDGRSFIRRSAEKYQVLQATLVDTWASTAAGAFALSENNLYTTDAFHDYLTHLTDDGFMAFTRWGFQPPRESLRLLTLATDALERLGEKDPWRHVIVIRENVNLISQWGATDTVLISRKPFSEDDRARVRQFIAETKKDLVYEPGMTGGTEFAEFLRTSDRAAYLAAYAYDISAVSDDRPFFFFTVQARDVWNYFQTRKGGAADTKINTAVPLLFGLVIISALATIVVLALPPLLLGTRLPAQPGIRSFLLYFLFIGTGYIVVQISLIQKFVLFLGHPTYALTVIVFSMLISSGLGSYYSRRIPVLYALGAVAVLISVLAFAVPLVSDAGVGWTLGARMGVTVLLIAPVGFVMGMPFPNGLSKLESVHHESVRWAWALNAASSVLGSALAIVFALYFGLRDTLLIGGLMYLFALLIYWKKVPQNA